MNQVDAFPVFAEQMFDGIASWRVSLASFAIHANGDKLNEACEELIYQLKSQLTAYILSTFAMSNPEPIPDASEETVTAFVNARDNHRVLLVDLGDDSCILQIGCSEADWEALQQAAPE